MAEWQGARAQSLQRVGSELARPEGKVCPEPGSTGEAGSIQSDNTFLGKQGIDNWQGLRLLLQLSEPLIEPTLSSSGQGLGWGEAWVALSMHLESSPARNRPSDSAESFLTGEKDPPLQWVQGTEESLKIPIFILKTCQTIRFNFKKNWMLFFKKKEGIRISYWQKERKEKGKKRIAKMSH